MSKKTLLGAGLLAPLAAWAVLALSADDGRKADAGRKLDADKVGAAAGMKATTTKDGVVRIGWPRTDVKVEVDGMPSLTPGLIVAGPS